MSAIERSRAYFEQLHSINPMVLVELVLEQMQIDDDSIDDGRDAGLIREAVLRTHACIFGAAMLAADTA